MERCAGCISPSSVSGESGRAGPARDNDRDAAGLPFQEQRHRCIWERADTDSVLRPFLYGEPGTKLPRAKLSNAGRAAETWLGTDSDVASYGGSIRRRPIARRSSGDHGAG